MNIVDAILQESPRKKVAVIDKGEPGGWEVSFQACGELPLTKC